MRFRIRLLFLLLPQFVAAQVPDTVHRAPGTSVNGVVYDSVARTPLAGAIVQLVGTDTVVRYGRSVVSDSSGRFEFDGVPEGRYSIGFYHPMVDSLQLELPLRSVVIRNTRPVRIDLAIPSPELISAAICGASMTAGDDNALIGVVRDAATRAPVAGAQVSTEWSEITLGTGRVTSKRPRLVTFTKDNGWFTFCGVPSPGLLLLGATRGADSTDLIEVHMPREGFLRRELYLGPSRLQTFGDTAHRTDTLAALIRRVHIGNGRVRGIVVSEASGLPLPSAVLRVSDGPGTRANALGEWAFLNAPAGSRMLEVHALGYYPERRAVDVVDGVASIRVALATLRSVLDTVRVTVARSLFDRAGRDGFSERARTGMGRYLTPNDIVRWNPLVTSDLFKNLPGVRTERDAAIGEVFVMRGIFTRDCTPDVYVNGMYMSTIGPSDVDGLVRPKELAGIEIYTPGTVPAQFQSGLQECGSIVFWKK